MYVMDNKDYKTLSSISCDAHPTGKINDCEKNGGAKPIVELNGGKLKSILGLCVDSREIDENECKKITQNLSIIFAASQESSKIGNSISALKEKWKGWVIEDSGELGKNITKISQTINKNKFTKWIEGGKNFGKIGKEEWEKMIKDCDLCADYFGKDVEEKKEGNVYEIEFWDVFMNNKIKSLFKDDGKENCVGICEFGMKALINMLTLWNKSFIDYREGEFGKELKEEISNKGITENLKNLKILLYKKERENLFKKVTWLKNTNIKSITLRQKRERKGDRKLVIGNFNENVGFKIGEMILNQKKIKQINVIKENQFQWDSAKKLAKTINQGDIWTFISAMIGAIFDIKEDIEIDIEISPGEEKMIFDSQT